MQLTLRARRGRGCMKLGGWMLRVRDGRHVILAHDIVKDTLFTDFNPRK